MKSAKLTEKLNIRHIKRQRRLLQRRRILMRKRMMVRKRRRKKKVPLKQRKTRKRLNRHVLPQRLSHLAQLQRRSQRAAHLLPRLVKSLGLSSQHPVQARLHSLALAVSPNQSNSMSTMSKRKLHHAPPRKLRSLLVLKKRSQPS